uniref:Maturase K n=2 Tax=Peperomia TaxID=13196 RepID=A0A0S1S0N5_9MAGN|nr:maturase K [Peperomia sp. 7 LF-2015]AOH73283.1 maturase K [Peperomia aff. hispiduliformis LF-2016]
MEKCKGYLETFRYQQKDFLYPLLFQEYIYALVHDHDLNGPIPYESIENLVYGNKTSSLIVKRLIIRMHKPNHFFISCNKNDFKQNRLLGRKNNFDLMMISEAFSIIVEIPFSFQLVSFLEKKRGEIAKFHNLQSIHSIFPFFEDNIIYLYHISDISIPYPIHPEIFVQILRSWIQDVPSLHLLRTFLYEYCNFGSLFSKREKILFLKKKKNERLSLFIYNYHVYEWEFIFFFLRKKSSHLRSLSWESFLERIHFYGKIQVLVGVLCNDFQKALWLFKDDFIHYVRYQGKYLLISKGTDLLMKKWRYHFIYLWQCNFYFWSQPHRIHRNQLSNCSFPFLGYFASVRRNLSLVKSKMLDSSFFMGTSIKKFETIVPILSLIGSMSKKKICNLLGHPTSKSIWTDSSDSDIMERFGRICRNLSHYYSGCSKKQILYRIKYILRLSCARTLAHKHKSTVRTFLKRLGPVFWKEFLVEEEQVLSFILPRPYPTISYRSNKDKERVWYLDITNTNDLTNHE